MAKSKSREIGVMFMGLMVALWAGSVSAATVRLTDDILAKVGDPVIVQLAFEGGGGLNELNLEALDLILGYDPTVLSYTAGNLGPALAGADSPIILNNAGTGQIIASITSINPITVSGTGPQILFETEFLILAGASPGPTLLRIEKFDVNEGEVDLTTPTLAAIDGQVSIVPLPAAFWGFLSVFGVLITRHRIRNAKGLG